VNNINLKQIIMKKKSLLSAALMLAAITASAQGVGHPKYVNPIPEGQTFHEAYQNWTPGQPLFQNDDDDEFYISRVKPRQRFTNANTQVDKNQSSNRKLLWWCPIGTTNHGNWNALPNYHFDSEVFTTWSYVDIYGNWTSNVGRAPAAFMDACHKNGVIGTTTDGIPYGHHLSKGDNNSGDKMWNMIQGGAEKWLKLCRQYGFDGIGYNSEFYLPNTSSDNISATNLQDFFADCYAKADAIYPRFTNVWYGFMQGDGHVGCSDKLYSGNERWFQIGDKKISSALMLNYNWGSSYLSETQNKADALNRSAYDVYAGMDFQGRNYTNWTALNNYDVSVGIWGAHDMNMVYECRTDAGSSDKAKQTEYQKIAENVFTGSSYNPVNRPAITNLLAHSSHETQFHGFSSFITARSTLITDDLANDPFVTYFNLGNGTYFNIAGQHQNQNEWYNLGMQDYMPTWRWWWTSSFMGRDANDVPSNGMKAAFTWEDAWFGGSCLAITGQTDLEYLQLFKTQYNLKAGDELRIRYKVKSGTGDIYWSCAEKDNENTAVSTKIASSLEAGNQWILKTIKVGKTPISLRMQDKTLAMLGLRFENTSSDFKLLIGEIALTRGASTTPEAPTLRKTVMLGSNYKGVDFKVIYKMAEANADGTPIYNSDVKAWYYKIYAQQEGSETITMCTATTSWAAYVVGLPLQASHNSRVRIGVSAVSQDGRSESSITWSDYQDIPSPTIVEGIEINKSVIKKGETFTVGYIDPNHESACWKILNARTRQVVGEEIENTTSVTTSLDQLGIYDLQVTCDGEMTEYPSYIQISGQEVGAVPEIQSITANQSEEPINVKTDTKVTFEYTGRKADGSVSRGLRLQEKAFGVPCEQLHFDDHTPFSICFWFCPDKFTHGAYGTQFFNVRSPKDPWPSSDWGYIWSDFSVDNTYALSVRKKYSNAGTQFAVEDYSFAPKKWYHFALIMDYQGGRIMKLYVNGRLIKETEAVSDVYAWKNSNVIMVGGPASGRAGFDGYIDEYQLYNKGLTEEEVLASMKHFETAPEGLIGYWDFEQAQNAEGYLMSTGKNKALKATTMKLEGEKGKNIFTPIGNIFSQGAPFIPGENYQITTEAHWQLGPKASCTVAATGNDLAGQIQAKYTAAGTYTASLTLENGWGKDTQTFDYVKVEGLGIDENDVEAAYQAYPNPFENQVALEFTTEGDYEVRVLDLSGREIMLQKLSAQAHQVATLCINGAPGTYLVKIRKGKQLVKVLKLLKK
jgi:endo-beta-N-acetylglucosaminidase D